MDIFIEISLILVAATVVALIMQRLHQPLIIGHILSGIVLGPLVFNVIHSKSTLEVFSQFGITMLLFLVGLNLTPSVIREVGKTLLIVGFGQMLVTSGLGVLLGRWLGLSWVTAVYLGVAFAFSSTIIVTKALADKKDAGKLYGKIAIGFLLVQDVIAVFMLIAIASMQQGVSLSGPMLEALAKGVFAVLAVILAGIYVLPRLTSLFASSQEFLFLFSLGWGLGIAALFQGLGLTGEIGALVAGISLAASPYHYEISSKMRMLRDFFLVLFFVLLGAQLSLTGIESVWKTALIFSIFILVIDPLIVMVLMGLMGYSKKTSFLAALTVAQISEFSILMVLFAIKAGQLAPETLTLVTLVGFITIGCSSYLLRYAEKIYSLLAPALSIFERKNPKREQKSEERFEAVLFGFHRVGSDFLPVLDELGLSCLVVDFDPEIIQALEAEKIPCRYGDAEDDAFLDELHLSELKVLISTVPDFDVNAQLVKKIRRRNKQAVVIVIAHAIEEAMALYDAGATYVVMPHFLGGNYGSLLLKKYGQDVKKFEHERKHHVDHLLSKVTEKEILARG